MALTQKIKKRIEICGLGEKTGKNSQCKLKNH
jgi:hypothetical protein